MRGGFVRIEPEWAGETAFLICGGPSAAHQPIDALRGRRVVVVNSSVYRAPWADVLFFADYERWGSRNKTATKEFKGRVLSAAYGTVHCDTIKFLRRPKPSDCPVGLSSDPSEIWLRFTSTRGAINLLCHLGVSRIVTLGLDGGPDAQGKTHHHQLDTHPGSNNPSRWTNQYTELAGIVQPLRDRGVELLNASPGSKLPFWPIVELKDVI